MEFRSKIKEYAETPISRHMIMETLSEYKSPNDKISELIKSKNLIQLRRGLYTAGSLLDLPLPEPFLIANHLRGPSYVSLESALAYWNLIPERATEISSVTIKSTKTYNTEIGRFSYKKLDAPYYSFGIRKIDHSPKQTYLIACPEKALCDKIILTPGINLRSVKQTREFLIEDLRIDIDELKKLAYELIATWADDAPKKSSLKMLIKTLRKL